MLVHYSHKARTASVSLAHARPCCRAPYFTSQVRQYTTERALPLLQVDTRSKAWVFESTSALSGGTVLGKGSSEGWQWWPPYCTVTN